MKKNLNKKLSLRKSTVTNLERRTMKDIRGGYITASCPEPPFNCVTDEHNCTTGCGTIK
jgi:hypothetical protein